MRFARREAGNNPALDLEYSCANSQTKHKEAHFFLRSLFIECTLQYTVSCLWSTYSKADSHYCWSFRVVCAPKLVIISTRCGMQLCAVRIQTQWCRHTASLWLCIQRLLSKEFCLNNVPTTNWNSRYVNALALRPSVSSHLECLTIYIYCVSIISTNIEKN